MYRCGFKLNDQPLSSFIVGTREFVAFSGMSPFVNRRAAACMANVGPIPPGAYYICDRESGGLFGRLYDVFGQRGDWFALYAIDQKMDDEMYCNEIKRGNFRLHPKVGRGISRGCITIDRQADFNVIRVMLKAGGGQQVSGSGIRVYGTVQVQ